MPSPTSPIRAFFTFVLLASGSVAGAEAPPSPRAALRGGEAPELARDDDETLRRLRERAYAETDPERRGHALFALHEAAFRVGSATCRGDACVRVVETRLNLYRTAIVRDLHARAVAEPAARPLACAAGDDVPACLQAAFDSDWLGTNAAIARGRVAFVSATDRGDDRVTFVVGDAVIDADGRAFAAIVLAEATVVDPSLAALEPGLRTSVGPREPLEADGYVVIPGARTLRLSRPLRADEPIVAVCEARVVRVDRPALDGIDVGEVEWGDGGVFPAYRYRLPCVARVVLPGLPGLRAGRSASAPLGRRDGDARTTVAGAVTIVEDGHGACQMTAEGVSWRIDRHACDLRFVGDLNGDGRADAVFDVRGEMGCGGPQLLLSDPTGWYVGASSGGYC